jgi:hypothetical protein
MPIARSREGVLVLGAVMGVVMAARATIGTVAARSVLEDRAAIPSKPCPRQAHHPPHPVLRDGLTFSGKPHVAFDH